jgi:6-pyruvoyltetrahydropterin/6-carboxytetrahydropterin synthase
MYEVSITESFSSAHKLADIGGKCEELHGHNFKVEVTLGGSTLNANGLLIDFRLVKKYLKEILGHMDHQHLNELPFFRGVNPSSENLAHYIYNAMGHFVVTHNVKIVRIKVWESENSAVTYSEGN